MPMQRQIILASISPRRRELMKLLKIKFKAVDPEFDEKIDPKLSHTDLVKFLALGKADAAAKKYPGAVIIAADTMVSFKGKVIGKPKNAKDAFKMLKAFSGKPHLVHSGVAVLDAKSKKLIIGHDTTKVYFKKLSHQDINKHIASGQAMDKAGGYGPLGSGLNLIRKIEGDGTTQFGLPLMFVSNALMELGVKF